MAKNSRFLESLVHDIPMYPFSSTPDGRIVAELHRGRRESKEFQERALAIQERAIERLADLHKGAMLVPAGDFRSSEAARILGDVAFEMQNVYTAQERSAQGIEALGQATTEGFGQVHDDLTDIKGPPYPHEHLDGLIENDGDFFAAMCAYSKGMLNQKAKSQFGRLFEMKMKPLQNAVPSLEAELETKIREEQLRALEEMNEAQGKKQEIEESLLPPLKTLKDFPEIREALKLFRNPLSLLSQDRDKVYSHLAVLAEAGERYDIGRLRASVRYIDRFFREYRRAQQTPVPQEMLVHLGRNHLLVPAVQHEVLKCFPETRDDASLTTINYSLLDIARDTRAAIQQRNILAVMGAASIKQQQGLYEQGETAIQQRDASLGKMDTMIGQNETALEQRERGLQQGEVAIRQREVANYHLASIVGNLVEIKEGMVDLGEIVEDFASMVEGGLEQINNTLELGFGVIDVKLQAIQAEMVLTRTAVVAELRRVDESILYVGQGIINSIERTNELLSELVEMTRNSKQNEARQYFEDGGGCLKTAEEMEHIEDAYNRFIRGVEAHGMTVENHYGAALCAELLGRLEEAKKRYITLIARCKDSAELKSQGQEGLARVEYKSGNLPEAVKQFKEAVSTNPKNFSARFNHAKYLALQGLWDEAVEVWVALINDQPDWYLKIKTDEVFVKLSTKHCVRFYSSLKDSEGTQALSIKAHILHDILTLFRDAETVAIMIIQIMQISPQELIKGRIWLNPGFDSIREILASGVLKYLDKELQQLTAKTCYTLGVLLYCMGFGDEVIAKVLQNGVRQDPLYYKKTPNKKQAIFDQIASIEPQNANGLREIYNKINLPNL